MELMHICICNQNVVHREIRKQHITPDKRERITWTATSHRQEGKLRTSHRRGPRNATA